MKKLAKLTPEEDRAWEKNMEFWWNEGYSDDEADRASWISLKEEFPRLKEFDAIEPANHCIECGYSRVNHKSGHWCKKWRIA